MLVLRKQCKLADECVKLAFPANKKRKVFVNKFRGHANVNSYWDGGSKSEYKIVNYVTRQVTDVSGGHPFYEGGKMYVETLDTNCALVDAGVTCGKTATPGVSFPEEVYATLKFESAN